MAALPGMLEHDRKLAGLVGRASGAAPGVSVREYRVIEAGEQAPAWETWDRICKLFGWGHTFAPVNVPLKTVQ